MSTKTDATVEWASEDEEVAEIRRLLRGRILGMLRKKNSPLRGSSIEQFIRFLRDYDAAQAAAGTFDPSTFASGASPVKRHGGIQAARSGGIAQQTALQRLVGIAQSKAATTPQPNPRTAPSNANLDDDGRIISSDLVNQ